MSQSQSQSPAPGPAHPSWDADRAAARGRGPAGGPRRRGVVPPELDGSLPVELAARAQVLVARQRELMGRTASAISATRRGVDDLDKVNVFAGAERAAPPVYLDLRA